MSQSEQDHYHSVYCSIDEGLNEQFYIVPGMGDFGDRYATPLFFFIVLGAGISGQVENFTIFFFTFSLAHQ